MHFQCLIEKDKTWTVQLSLVFVVSESLEWSNTVTIVRTHVIFMYA